MRPGVTGIPADERIKRVEHCDVDNRHCPTGAAWPELFSENTVLAGSDWSMIETSGINGDHVPTVKRIESLPRAYKRRNVGSRAKQRAKCLVESVIRSEGKGQKRQNEGSKQQRRFFHVIVSGDTLLLDVISLGESNFTSLN